MKKLCLFTLICLLVFSLVACSSPGKITDENPDSESTGDNYRPDGGTVTYEGESGEEVNIGGNEWPTDMIAEDLPKLNAGEVSAAYNSANACMITVDNVKKEQFEDYLEGIKDLGYTENALDISSGESIHYYAENGEFGIQITYDGETGEAGVNFTRLEF